MEHSEEISKLFVGSAPLECSLFPLSQKHTGAVLYEMGFFPYLCILLEKLLLDEDIIIQILIELNGKDDEY